MPHQLLKHSIGDIDQLSVRASLHHGAVLNDGYGVRSLDGAESVRDGEDGPVLWNTLEGFPDQVFWLGVQSAGRLVQDYDARVLKGNNFIGNVQYIYIYNKSESR